MKRFFPLIMFVFSPFSEAALHEEIVEYKAADTALTGYLVWDDSKGAKQPGVLVVHEWWGLNDYARQRARMLAELGYTALAVDMYGSGKTTEHASEASGFVKTIQERAGASKERFLAAKAVLEKQATVEPGKIAAIGYCFGGSTVLNMARTGVDLAAVVSFHGNLATQTPAGPGSVKAKVLVLSGADDDFITPESVADFNREMTAAGADYRFIDYPGAKHGFTNPDADRLGKANNIPIAYQAKADHDSWLAMQELFKQVFGR